MKALKIILASAICCAFVYAEEVKVENAPAPAAATAFQDFDLKNKEFQAKRSDLMKEMKNLKQEQKEFFMTYTKDMNESQKKEFFAHLKENKKDMPCKGEFKHKGKGKHDKKMEKRLEKCTEAKSEKCKMSHEKMKDKAPTPNEAPAAHNH